MSFGLGSPLLRKKESKKARTAVGGEKEEVGEKRCML